jgi:hypothetical protein
MLITIKAGSTVGGVKVPTNANQDHPREAALQMLASGIAKPVEPDKDGWIEIDQTHGAEVLPDVIRIAECGDTLFSLRAGFPLCEIAEVLRLYQAGFEKGRQWGHVERQGEIRRALGIVG